MVDSPQDKVIKIEKNNKNGQVSFEAKQNLLGFFSLLLKIDIRNNPEKYKNKELDNLTNKKC